MKTSFSTREIIRENFKKNKSLKISDELLKLYTELSNEYRVISDRIKIHRIRESRMSEAEKLAQDIIDLLSYIQDRLTINNEKKKSDTTDPNKSSDGPKRKSIEIRKSLNSLKTSDSLKKGVKYERLLQLVDDLELKYDSDLKLLFEILDEKFVQARALNKDDYYHSLTELRNEFINEED